MDNLVNYAPLVRSMARRYQGPGLEREDLEQEGWLALVEAAACYRPELNVPRPAYYRSRVRAALGSLLRRYRRDALFWRAGADVDRTFTWDEGSESGAVWLMGNLPRRQREALLLYYHYGFSLKEVAKRMGIGISAAHTHKTRGLAALARQMSL
jgi:RNA polymerase sigma factor (sigma-70 family)